MTPRMTTSFHPYLDRLAGITRQQFVRSTSLGLGAAALNSLLNSSATADQTLVDPFAPRRSHFPARVKNVILLSMSGGPSHLDLFDYKPELLRRNGEECPQSLMEGKPFAFTGSTARYWGRHSDFSNSENLEHGCLRQFRTFPRLLMNSHLLNRCTPNSSIMVRQNSYFTQESHARPAVPLWAHGSRTG